MINYYKLCHIKITSSAKLNELTLFLLMYVYLYHNQLNDQYVFK